MQPSGPKFAAYIQSLGIRFLLAVLCIGPTSEGYIPLSGTKVILAAYTKQSSTKPYLQLTLYLYFKIFYL